MGSVMDCKRNPCCGDIINCTFPSPLKPGETWEEYERRTKKEQKGNGKKKK